MTKKSRAKQFLPFDALKGFKEALDEKQIKYEDKKELTEESYNSLQEEWNKIDKQSIVEIKYYKNKRYIQIQGRITNMDYIKRKIKIDDENINVCDILEIKVI